MDASFDYIPITLNAIQADTIVGFDLYLQSGTSEDNRYILYCSEANIIRSDKIDELSRNQIKRFFIRKEDHKKFLQYAESSLQNIISNQNIDIQIKSQVVYDVARNIMIDVFEDPRAGEQVQRSKGWVSNAVDFVMNNKGTFKNMVSILSYDYYTYTHSVNVSVLGLMFSKYIGLTGKEMKALGTGLLLHDIGKTQIGNEIVNKHGKLSEEEFREIKMHVELGMKILGERGEIEVESVFPILQHHERYDGKGYPNGLKGDDIHTYGKIAKIIDVYDAITTRRSYSDARVPFLALKIMKDDMAGSFDGKLFRDFVLFLGSAGEKK